MAKRIVRHLSFLVTTVILAACGGGGGDQPANLTASPAATSSAPQSPSSPSANPSAPQSTASLTLEWNANTEPDLAGYKIYGATSSGAYGAANATVPASATSFVVSGLKPGVTYFFVISAFDTAGNESVRSAEVSASL
jgi:predicted phage tail protein